MLSIERSLHAPGPDLAGLIAQTAKFFEAAKAPATRTAYASDLRDFEKFCASNVLQYLPSTVETVALYISHLASRVPQFRWRRSRDGSPL